MRRMVMKNGRVIAEKVSKVKHAMHHLPYCLISCTLIHLVDAKWHVFDVLFKFLGLV